VQVANSDLRKKNVETLDNGNYEILFGVSGRVAGWEVCGKHFANGAGGTVQTTVATSGAGTCSW
jgi:hypothetical protein